MFTAALFAADKTCKEQKCPSINYWIKICMYACVWCVCVCVCSKFLKTMYVYLNRRTSGCGRAAWQTLAVSACTERSPRGNLYSCSVWFVSLGLFKRMSLSFTYVKKIWSTRVFWKQVDCTVNVTNNKRNSRVDVSRGRRWESRRAKSLLFT